MFVLDTNVLVYAADRASGPHGPCRELVERSRRKPGAFYLTWGIVYELLRVTTHPRVFVRPWSIGSAWQFITAVLAAPGAMILQETERHAEVFAQVLDEVPLLEGNLLHDAHTATLMREHGIRSIYTRDADFHRFTFLEVLDPLVR